MNGKMKERKCVLLFIEILVNEILISLHYKRAQERTELNQALNKP